MVKFGALGFWSLSNAATYVAKNLGALNFGLFVDVYVVLLLVSKEIEGKDDFLCKLEQVKKLEIASMRKASALVTFSSLIPDMYLEAESGTYGKIESSFIKFRAYKDWKEKGKKKIQKKLATVKEGLLQTVASYVKARTLVHGAMLLSIAKAVLKLICSM